MVLKKIISITMVIAFTFALVSAEKCNAKVERILINDGYINMMLKNQKSGEFKVYVRGKDFKDYTSYLQIYALVQKALVTQNTIRLEYYTKNNKNYVDWIAMFKPGDKSDP